MPTLPGGASVIKLAAILTRQVPEVEVEAEDF